MQKLIELFLLLSFSFFSLVNAAPKSINDDILQNINTYRLQHGLNELKMNTLIAKEATKHSQDMAENRVPFGHDGFNSRMLIINTNFHTYAIAENVAFANPDPKAIVNLWLHSKGHRKNIEGNYTLTGIGSACDKYGNVYVTQLFCE